MPSSSPHIREAGTISLKSKVPNTQGHSVNLPRENSSIKALILRPALSSIDAWVRSSLMERMHCRQVTEFCANLRLGKSFPQGLPVKQLVFGVTLLKRIPIFTDS